MRIPAAMLGLALPAAAANTGGLLGGVADAPYVETVPFQFVYQGTFPRAPSWGVLPEPCCIGQVAAVATTSAAAAAATTPGSAAEATLLKFDSGGVYVARRDNTTYPSLAHSGDAAAYAIESVAVTGADVLLKDATSRLLVTPAGAAVGVVSSTGVAPLQCSLAAGTAPTCAGGALTAHSFGPIADVSFGGAAAADGGGDSFLVVSGTGLHRVVFPAAGGGAPAVTTFREEAGLSAVGLAPFSGSPTPASPRASGAATAFVAGSDFLYVLNAETGAVTHVEWISNFTSGSGGAVDGPVATIAFDAGAQRVLLGTENALNVVVPSLQLTRVSGRQGLPYGNITALAARSTAWSTMGAVAGNKESQTWVGTKMGLAVWQASSDPPFRYLYGPRWLPGAAVASLAVHDSDDGPGGVPATVVAATDGGVAFLEQQLWTLADKAAVFEAALPRALRHGLTAECHLGAFGDVSGPGRVCSDSDNNGLWTGMAVAAEYFRGAATAAAAGDHHASSDAAKNQRSHGTRVRVSTAAAPAAVASELFRGQSLLHNVTGLKGLCARSACGPTDAQCAPGRATDLDPACKATPATCGLQWRNGSAAAGYGDGWVWKSDTSSDEIDGHVLALSVVAALSPDADERVLAAQLLVNLVDRIVDGGMCLIDWTGKPTTWGRWAPEDINSNQAYSDEHGVNALEIMANLAGGIAAAGGAAPAQLDKFEQGVANLTRPFPGPDYLGNLINLRIQVPWDENFSDDELIMLPFLSLVFVDRHSRGGSVGASVDMDQIRDALHHVWQLVSPGRSSLWSAIALYGEQGQSTPRMTPAEQARATNDMLWNLRSWPRDHVTWNVSTSHRRDIVFNPEPDRFAGVADQSYLRVLPANERQQQRWNANPWQVGDSGDGMLEVDPGAFLLPYWLARYGGLLTDAAAAVDDADNARTI